MKKLNLNYLIVSVLCLLSHISLQAQNTCAVMSINSTTIAVTNTNDSGFGSLRQAIICVNDETAYFRIEFQLTAQPPHIINVTSAPLPAITAGMTMDATTNGLDPGDVIIRNNGNIIDGLTFTDGFSAVYGLQIEGFGNGTIGAGIFMNSPFCRVTIGAADQGNILTNNTDGIEIRGDADALIYGNTITNNTLRGIYATSLIEGGTFVKIGNEFRPLSNANLIANNGVGVEVESDAAAILMNINQFSCNSTEAIRLDNATGSVPSAPIISTANEDEVAGTATPGDSIYVFLSDNSTCTAAPCQGSRFLGRTSAPNGTWSLSNANIETDFTLLEGGSVTALALRPLTFAATCGEEFPPIRSHPSEFANCRIINTPCMISEDGTTVVVTNTNDEGAGSLREAINCANAIEELDNIVFDFQQGSAPFIINVGSTSGELLPPLFDENISIDATINGYALGDVILDGAGLNLPVSDGLIIRGNGISVYGLHLRNFLATIGAGIYVISGENINIGAANKGVVLTNNNNGVEAENLSLTVSHSFIGVEADGINIGGNTQNGIILSNTAGDLLVNNCIIAYNQTGISSTAGEETAITNTSLFCNQAAGLNLPNSTQPIPQITEASPTMISGTGVERIEIYKQDGQTCSDASIFQGKTLVGTTDAVSGLWSLSSTDFEPGVTLADGDILLATSSDVFSFLGVVIYINTSPYSNPVFVIDPCVSINGGTTIEVTNTNDTGPGSLRQAIECANADPLLDRIIFNIPGLSYPEVQPQDELPLITDEGIIIDATTQTGGGIVLECSDGAYFRVSAANFEVRGIEFINFDTWAVYVESGDNAIIENNIFDGEFGTFTRPVRINSDGATVLNNIFKNANDGMFITGNQAAIGGDSFAEANYFYNCGTGLVLFEGDFHKVYFNYFGLDENGMAQGNTNAGVRIMEGASNCLINDNEIAYNDYGIFLSPPDGGVSENNTFSTNIMYCNVTNGIELSTSTNNNQAAPIISAANTAEITGTGDAGEIIEVFIHDEAACSFPCQGRIFIGSTNVQSDGTWALSPNQTLADGMSVTATTTDQAGNTSEFSTCVSVCPSVLVTVDNGGPYCEGDIINLFATFTPESDNYFYNWEGPDDYFSTEQNPSDATVGGIYRLFFSDACSDFAPVFETEVIVNPRPIATAATLDACANPSGEAIFDLTVLNETINGNSGNFVSFYRNNNANSLITNPTAYQSPSATIFATQLEGDCESFPVPITLIVNTLELTCAEQSPPTTPNGTDGVAEITIIGNNGPYTYQFTGPVNGTETVTASGTYTISNLSAGDYEVIVTDDFSTDNCQDTCSFTINSPDCALQLEDVMVENVLCNGDATGSITVETTGGFGALTYEWTPDVSTTNQASNLPAGTYIVMVQDEANCTASDTVTINEPTALMLTCTGSTLDTPQSTNGTGQVSISGSTAPYTYRYMVGSNTMTETAATAGDYTINNLAAGTYVVTVSDVNNCQDSCSFVVQSPGCELSIENIVIENVLCNGDSTGSLIVETTGGFGALTYEWTPDVSTTNQANDLPAGTYIVMVQDEANCTASDTVTINEPIALMLTCTGSTLDTPQSTNGTGQVSISGSTAPYTYRYMVGSNTMTETAATAGDYTINNLAAGTYVVTVSDVNNCQDSCSFVVQSPGCELSIENIVIENVLCNGDSTGSLAVETTGGFGALTYEWSPDVSTSNEASNLPAGTYIVMVQDEANCMASDTVTINEPTALMLTCTGSILETPQSTNGTGQVSISGSTAPYTYRYMVGNNTMTETAATAGDYTINNLAAGTYVVTVSDVNNCQDSCSFVVQSPGCELSIENIVIENVLCNSDSTGSLAVETTGGFGALTYEWTPDVSTSNEASNLPAGTYIVMVQDEANCMASDTVTINEPTALMLTCTGSILETPQSTNGTGQVSISGSTAPYVYSYMVGEETITASVDTAGTYTINNLSVGTYMVTVSDVNNCQDSCSFVVQSPGCELSIENIVIENVLCNGDSTGSLIVETTGGFGTLTYEWSPDVSNDSLASNLPAGTYIVMVQDEANCMASDTVTINEPTALMLTCTGSILETPQSTNGTGQVSISGSTAPYVYSYMVGEATITASVDTAGTYTINNLSVGTYMVTVSDVNNCQDSCSFVVQSPGCELSIENIVIENVLCNGDSTGSLTVETTGGFGTLTYEWSPDVSNDSLASNLPAGTYIVMVQDEANCMASDTVTINEPTALSLTCTGSTLEIPQSTNGTGQVSISGSTAPYVYSYMVGEATITASVDTAGTYTINNLSAGTYVVTVSDANDCQGTCSFTVEIPGCELSIENIVVENVLCNGDSTGSLMVETTGGFGVLTYNWTPDVSTTNQANDLPAGTYIVMVQDEANCTASDTVTINEPTALILSCTGSTLDTPQSTNGTGQVSISGSTAPYTYRYMVGSNTMTETAATAGDYTINNLAAGTYVVTVSDANDCQATCDFIIESPIIPDTVFFNATSSTTFSGEGVCLEVSVQNFSDIGMMSYSMAWDASVLAYDTVLISNETWGLEITDFDISNVENGILTVNWSTESENGVSFPDNTILYEVCFMAIGQPGDSSPFDFSSEGTDIIVVNNNNDNVPNNFDNGGGVTILGTPCDWEIEDILSNDVSCNGANDGSLEVVLSAIGTYTYDWNVDALDGQSNPTNVAAGFYAVTVTDDVGCVDSAIAVINQPVVTGAILTGSNDICLNEETALNFDFNGSPPFIVTYSDGENETTFTAFADTSLMLMPDVSTTYSLVSLIDANNCQGSVQGMAFVSVSEGPTISPTTAICDGLTYTVSFEVLSGTPPFSLSGPGGTWEGNLFTSHPIPASSLVYSFNLSNNCGTINTTGFSPCFDEGECIVNPGTMDTEPLDICANESTTAIHNGNEILEENDVLQFILHDSPDPTLGTLFALNDTPDFGIAPGMDLTQTYYISAIAGDDNGFGQVDLFDPCLAVAVGTPIRFQPAPPNPTFIAATDSIVCENSELTLITENSSNPDISYHWLTPQQVEITTEEPSLTYASAIASNAGAYQVFTTLGECTSTTTDSVVISILDVPGAFAEEDFTECGSSTTFIMAEQPDDETIAGWTVLTPTVEIDNRTSPEAEVSNLQFGDNHFLWTVSNEACTVYDTLTVNYAVPPVATDFTETLEKDKALIRFLPYQIENLFGIDLILDSTLFIIPPAKPRGQLDFDEASQWFVYTKSDTLPQEEFMETITFDYVICNPVPACENFCDTATITLNVRYDNSPDILVYGMLTPNNDGINDQLEIEGILQFPINRLIIVNRWGDIVYDKENYGTDAERWEGRFKNNATTLPQGAYYYYLEFKRSELDPWREATGVIHIIDK